MYHFTNENAEALNRMQVLRDGVDNASLGAGPGSHEVSTNCRLSRRNLLVQGEPDALTQVEGTSPERIGIPVLIVTWRLCASCFLFCVVQWQRALFDSAAELWEESVI